MTNQGAVAAICAMPLLACHILPENTCTSGKVQCNDNVLQSCYADEMFGGAYWHDLARCAPSQVCRVDDIAPSGPGCFAPNAYCPLGSTMCDSPGWSDSSLLACVLRDSDQTYRWVKTSCSAQVPKAVCLSADFSVPQPTYACYEVVENCPMPPAPSIHCEGNVLYQCTDPIVIDGKAVFDWQTIDCAQSGQVCRVTASGPQCASP